MSNTNQKNQKWSKGQVIEAFVRFFTFSSASNPEEQKKMFELCLDEIGKDEFETADIYIAMNGFVPGELAVAFTPIILGHLTENA